MADDADIAQAAAEQHMKAALTRIRRNPPNPPLSKGGAGPNPPLSKGGNGGICGESAKFCVDCGTPIPEKRRLAVPGCKRCTRCETEFEDEFGWY